MLRPLSSRFSCRKLSWKVPLKNFLEKTFLKSTTEKFPVENFSEKYHWKTCKQAEKNKSLPEGTVCLLKTVELGERRAPFLLLLCSSMLSKHGEIGPRDWGEMLTTLCMYSLSLLRALLPPRGTSQQRKASSLLCLFVKISLRLLSALFLWLLQNA